MNCGTVTAVMKTFIERLIGFVDRPWGMKAPRVRKERKDKQAVVASSPLSRRRGRSKRY